MGLDGAAREDIIVGSQGRPGRNVIGGWEVSAILNDWSCNPPAIEAVLWYGGEQYDEAGSVRFFRDRREFGEFLQGLRQGKTPTPMTCDQGADAALRQLLGEETDEDQTTKWDEL